MKKVYLIKVRVMNGSVTMRTLCDVFTTKELAEETKLAIKKANRTDSTYTVLYDDVEELDLFETKDEVPILNKE